MTMPVKTTPEKVKSLLSSFLASSKKQSTIKSININPKRDHHDKEGSDNTSALSTSNLRSYDSFVERLDTFSSITWFGKTSELSPLICARYGWANIDIDSLQCVGCKAHLCGKLPDQSDINAYKVFKEKLKKDILAAHDKFCVLAANPCPESFCLIPCDDPTTLLSDFTDHILSFDSVSSSLPSIDYSSLHSYNYDEGQGAAYCKRLLMPDSDPSPDVVALAVTGWSSMPSKSDILTCSKCRRQVGLWNFDKESDVSIHRKEDESRIEDDGEPCAKKSKSIMKSSFNPVEEHKHWCPWLIPTAQPSTSSSPAKSSSAGGKRAREEQPTSPAFIVALRVIAPGLMDNNTGLAQAMKVSPVADGLRCFRRVMKAWSSPKSVTDHSAMPTRPNPPKSSSS